MTKVCLLLCLWVLLFRASISPRSSLHEASARPPSLQPRIFPLPSSFIFNILFAIFSPPVLRTCPNQLSLTSLTLSQSCSTWAVSLMCSFLILSILVHPPRRHSSLPSDLLYTLPSTIWKSLELFLSMKPHRCSPIIISLLNVASITLSRIVGVRLISFIPLYLLQLCTSALFLKISTSTLLLRHPDCPRVC